MVHGWGRMYYRHPLSQYSLGEEYRDVHSMAAARVNFLLNIIAQLSVEGRFMTFHVAKVCIYCDFFWIRLLMFQSAIRVFTSPLQFYWHFSPSFHLCYSLNFTQSFKFALERLQCCSQAHCHDWIHKWTLCIFLKTLYPSTECVTELSASALQLNAFAWGYEIKIVICIMMHLWIKSHNTYNFLLWNISHTLFPTIRVWAGGGNDAQLANIPVNLALLWFRYKKLHKIAWIL